MDLNSLLKFTIENSASDLHINIGCKPKIRKDGKNEPAIFLTALRDMDNFKEGYQCGCSDYIRKPFDLEELVLRVEQTLVNSLDDNSAIVKISCDVTYDMKKAKLKIL